MKRSRPEEKETVLELGSQTLRKKPGETEAQGGRPEGWLGEGMNGWEIVDSGLDQVSVGREG